MIKIVCKSDLDGLEKLKIPDVLRKYINEYFEEMLLRFESESLKDFGSIFVLDSKEADLVTQKAAEMNAYPDERFHFKYGFGMPYKSHPRARKII